MEDQTIIRVNHVGRMANHIAQMMFVRTLQNLCRRSIVVEGFDLPDWKLSRSRSDTDRSQVSIGSHLTRANLIAAMIDHCRPRTIDLDGVILRSANFIGDYSDLFPFECAKPIFASNQLVIHLRLGDVAELSHPHYGPLPISYYRYLVDLTGLDPVFIGEIDDSNYCRTLRLMFPQAQFLGGHSAYEDFQMLRMAKNIAIAVSSYSWIASYLSRADSIHVPVAGMIDPRVRPEIDLLPIANQRYSFHSVSSWGARYSDHVGVPSDFWPISLIALRALRTKALLKTATQSLRIHAGAARRMALSDC